MKRCLNLLFVSSVVLFVFIYTKAAAAKTEYDYVVPPGSNKYHDPSCRWAKKSGSGDMATFRSAKDALRAGHIPCKVCRPPAVDS